MGTKGWMNRYLCLCGRETEAYPWKVKSGHTKSCGCAKKMAWEDVVTTHGLSRSNRRMYNIWKAMKARCINKNSQFYHRYGGRGIFVCKMWIDNFEEFYKWSIENGYDKDLTIDRKDNDGGYTPENCRWVGWGVQAENKSNTISIDKINEAKKMIEAGVRMSKIAVLLGISYPTVKNIRRRKYARYI